MLRFFGSFFRPNYNVDISETVYSIDLKFEVRIVVDHVPFQIRKKRIYSRARTIRGRELLEGEHYFKVEDPSARTIRGRALIEGENYSVY